MKTFLDVCGFGAFLALEFCLPPKPTLSIPSPNWSMKPGFHVTTPMELAAETEREHKAMWKAGFEGDPSITMGEAYGVGGRDVVSEHWSGYSRSPGAYNDGHGEFEPGFTVYSDNKTCSLTEEQYDWIYIQDQDPNRSYVRHFSQERLDILARSCLDGKLPKAK